MKRSVVHDDNISIRRHGRKLLSDPCLKNISIYAAIRQGRSRRSSPGQCADRVRPLFRRPVMLSETSCAVRRITEKSGHVLGEAALININHRNIHQFINFDLHFKQAAGLLVGFRMKECFFFG